MNGLRLIAVTLVFSLLLSGCWNARQIENLLYVNALGIDYVDDKFVVYAQILSFSTIAKQEAGGDRNTKPIVIAKASGEAFTNALFQLYPSAQQQLTWSHVRTIVFSVRSLQNKVLNQVLDEINRFYEFRYTLWTYATEEPIMDIFNAKQLFTRPLIYSQLEDPQDLYPQNSILQPLKLFQFNAKRAEPNGVVYLPTLSITNTTWSEGKDKIPKLKTDGACLFQSRELKRCWPRSEIIGQRWLNEDTVRTLLGVRRGKEELALVILSNPTVKITPTLRNGQPFFQIDVGISGFITQMLKITPVEQIEQAAEKIIEDEIRGLYAKGWKQQIDTLNLGHTFYKKHAQDWKRLAKSNTLPLTPDSLEKVNIRVRLTHSGMNKIKQLP